MKLLQGMAAVGLAAMGLIGAILWLLYFLLHVSPFMGETFTPEKWAEAGSCMGLTDYQCVEKQESCRRGPMVRSLIRSHLTTGTERNSVLSLLGPAESKDKDGCLDWSLGMCSGLGIDYDSLLVCFDSSAKVVKASHIQH